MFSRRRVLQALLASPVWPLSAAHAQTSSGASASTSSRSGAASLRQRQVFGTGPTRVALLIESQSEAFAPAARAVIAGVRAAWSIDGLDIAVEVVPLGERDESLPRVLSELGERGFSLALGPLTRDNVNTITDVGSLPMPLLALNLPDADRRVPYNIAFFSLAIEGESLQVAHEAWHEASARAGGQRAVRALLIGDNSALARRGLAAFSQRWSELGGVLADTIELDPAAAGEWRSTLADVQADATFVVVNPDHLPTLRAALPAKIPIYGTSQLNAVQANVMHRGHELDGVRLIDMPWQIDPANPKVKLYPRERTLRHLDFQRLYALGIDAYRLGLLIFSGARQFELDGVTGWLRVDLQNDLRVERQSLAAEFRGGQIVPLRTPAR